MSIERVLENNRTVMVPKRIDKNELTSAMSSLVRNKRIKDKLYLVTVKNLVGSSRHTNLKFNIKKIFRDLFKIPVTKIDYIFTIEIDETNSLNLDFLMQQVTFHSHIIISTNLKEEAILRAFERFNQSNCSKPIETRQGALDIRIDPITEELEDYNKAIRYISKDVPSMGLDSYDFKVKI